MNPDAHIPNHLCSVSSPGLGSCVRVLVTRAPRAAQLWAVSK